MEKHKYRWYDLLLLPWRCAPVWTIFRIILLFIVRALPAVQIFATAAFIDGAFRLLRKEVQWETLIIPVIVLASIIIINHLGAVIANILKQFIGNGIRLRFVDYLTKKCAKLPCAEIENHETWDLIERIKTESDVKIERGFENLLNLVGIFIQAGSFLAVLFFEAWWSVFLVLIVGGIVVYFALKGGKNQYDAEKNVSEFRRHYQYYGNVMVSRDFVDERNLFHFFPLLQRMWEKNYFKTRDAEKKVTVRYLVRIKLVSSFMAIVTFGIAALLLFPLSRGSLSPGIYISLIQAANGVVDLMSWELSDCVNLYAQYIEYVKDIVTFSNLPEVSGALDLPTKEKMEIRDVEFRNVSFTYPGTDREILRNVNLKIKAGRHYAIVGGNGAGKTTIIKLLTGLYTEFEGEILINDMSIREYKLSELKAMLSVLFQDFARYEISVEDNIALGNILQKGTESQSQAIEQALYLVGMDKKIEALSEGMKTRLGKLSEESKDLSGGEWQRIAMARTMISPADLLILDEPTSALDPMSESGLYQKFAQISGGRTTIFISHRLGSTMLADEIIVLDQGVIIGQGSHDFLISTCPLYRQMYENQRDWYIENA